MRRRSSLLSLALALAGLAACAPGAPHPASSAASRDARACFLPDQVRNFRSGATQTLYLRALDGEVFELNASGFCRDLEYATGVAIRPQAGSGPRLCVGDWALVGVGAEPCRARVARRLTAAEVEALPSRQRP